jgi:hypothetical protein
VETIVHGQKTLIDNKLNRLTRFFCFCFYESIESSLFLFFLSKVTIIVLNKKYTRNDFHSNGLGEEGVHQGII